MAVKVKVTGSNSGGTKYHVSKDGKPNVCKAKNGGCPYGDSEHINASNVAEANVFAEKVNEARAHNEGYSYFNNTTIEHVEETASDRKKEEVEAELAETKRLARNMTLGRSYYGEKISDLEKELTEINDKQDVSREQIEEELNDANELLYRINRGDEPYGKDAEANVIKKIDALEAELKGLDEQESETKEETPAPVENADTLRERKVEAQHELADAKRWARDINRGDEPYGPNAPEMARDKINALETELDGIDNKLDNLGEDKDVNKPYLPKKEIQGYGVPGWEGAKYDINLDIKDVSKNIRSEIKDVQKSGSGRIPADAKISVKTDRFAGGAAINIDVTLNKAEEREYDYDPSTGRMNSYGKTSAEIERIQSDVQGIADQYNRDTSNAMADYTNVNFYDHVSVRGMTKYDLQDNARQATTALHKLEKKDLDSIKKATGDKERVSNEDLDDLRSRNLHKLTPKAQTAVKNYVDSKNALNEEYTKEKTRLRGWREQHLKDTTKEKSPQRTAGNLRFALQDSPITAPDGSGSLEPQRISKFGRNKEFSSLQRDARSTSETGNSSEEPFSNKDSNAVYYETGRNGTVVEAIPAPNNQVILNRGKLNTSSADGYNIDSVEVTDVNSTTIVSVDEAPEFIQNYINDSYK